MANRSSAVWRYFNITATDEGKYRLWVYLYLYFAYTTSIGTYTDTYTGIGTTLHKTFGSWLLTSTDIKVPMEMQFFLQSG